MNVTCWLPVGVLASDTEGASKRTKKGVEGRSILVANKNRMYTWMANHLDMDV